MISNIILKIILKRYYKRYKINLNVHKCFNYGWIIKLQVDGNGLFYLPHWS